ncbi:MAG: hypothetical protein ACLFV4_05940 [Candidatus Hydrogenedentota bacterium]
MDSTSEPSLIWDFFGGLLRLVFRLLVLVALVGLAVFLWFSHEALYNRFVVFPEQARQWEAIRETRQEIGIELPWEHFRGVAHAHSEHSHDSLVSYEEILEAAHAADIDFMLMSDHCVDGEADYGLGWRGVHDGVLFVPGFETASDLMPWGLPSDTVLDCDENLWALAERIEDEDGLLFFAHPEGHRFWDVPQLDGMEILNLHTMFNRADISALAPNVLLSRRRYPDQVMWLVEQPMPMVQQRWDDLNRMRRIVGIAGNDAHQNVGVRLVGGEDGGLRLERTDGGLMREWPSGTVSAWVLRRIWGAAEPGEVVWRFDLDPYERSLRFMNTHILADELSEDAVLEALELGRVYVAFDMIADARGFAFVAEGSQGQGHMGQEIPWEEGLELHAASPYPGRIRLLRHGAAVHETEGREMTYEPELPGNYRVEVDLAVGDEWVTWLYTNPIRIQ